MEEQNLTALSDEKAPQNAGKAAINTNGNVNENEDLPPSKRPKIEVENTASLSPSPASVPTQLSAYEEWLQENQQATPEEAPLIEDIQEEAVHQPSTEELAADATFTAFENLLPNLTPHKDSINTASAAALKAASAGAGRRAVRAVMDAVAACEGPVQRLPHLYLLDAAIKAELKQANDAGKDALPLVLPRAVGAALPRLVEALQGNDVVVAKLEKVLTLWRTKGFVNEALVVAALDIMAAYKAEISRKATEEASAVPAHGESDKKTDVEELLRSIPMNAELVLSYTLKDGSQRVLRPPPPVPLHMEDWQSAEDLGLKIPPRPLHNFLSPIKHEDQAADGDISPWRRQIASREGFYNNRQPALASAAIPGTGGGIPDDSLDELDEFDQGLLRDAVGGVAPVAALQPARLPSLFEAGGEPLPRPPPLPPLPPPPPSDNLPLSYEEPSAVSNGRPPPPSDPPSNPPPGPPLGQGNGVFMGVSPDGIAMMQVSQGEYGTMTAEQQAAMYNQQQQQQMQYHQHQMMGMGPWPMHPMAFGFGNVGGGGGVHMQMPNPMAQQQQHMLVQQQQQMVAQQQMMAQQASMMGGPRGHGPSQPGQGPGW